MKIEEQHTCASRYGFKFACFLLAAALLSACAGNPQDPAALTDVACANQKIGDDFLVCIVFESAGNQCPTEARFAGSKDKSPLIKDKARKIVWQAVKLDSSSTTGYKEFPVLFKVASNPFSGSSTKVESINNPDGTATSKPLGTNCDNYAGACIADPGNPPVRDKEEVVYKYAVQKYVRSGPGKAKIDVNCPPLDPVFRVML